MVDGIEMSVRIETISQSAIEFERKVDGGKLVHFANFDENGHIFNMAKAFSDEERQELSEAALRVAPEVKAKRKEFRARLRAEKIRAESDPRIPHPCGHTSNWQGISEDFQKPEIARLEALGYTTAKSWTPMCKHDGASIYSLLMWPPFIPDEERYEPVLVRSLWDLIPSSDPIPEEAQLDLSHLKTQAVPEGIVYDGVLRAVYPGGETSLGIHAILMTGMDSSDDTPRGETDAKRP